jgi:hypothetical protein
MTTHEDKAGVTIAQAVSWLLTDLLQSQCSLRVIIFCPSELPCVVLLLRWCVQESIVSRLRLADVRDHQEQLQDDPSAQLSNVSTTCIDSTVMCGCRSTLTLLSLCVAVTITNAMQ